MISRKKGLSQSAGPYLIFVISFTQAGFSKTKFYTQNLHLTENSYTDTVCGVCDKYAVCLIHHHLYCSATLLNLSSNDFIKFKRAA